MLDSESHHELVGLIRNLRKIASQGGRVQLDFKNTERVHSCGTLLLVAEIDRLVRSLGTSTISCTYPKDEKVEKVFQQVGLLKLLGKDHRLEITEEDRDVFHWKYASGIDVSPIQADPILKGIKAQIPKNYRKVVVGVEEAMDNSVHHAYIESRGDRMSGRNDEADARRWWLFAEVLDDWLHVNFCDLGIGIPRSLPKSWAEEAGDIVTLALSKAKKDVRMIRRAFEVGRTRTELEHRGKGLKNIAMAAEELGGLLTIHSNAGCIRKDFRGGGGLPRAFMYKRSIMGTVIQWSIPLKK
ncbi:ATP-binding protein [Pseudomonas sp. DG56-2]|uniref:ATP-binding protein n=1 Tax=Pseudomonas sp. DG56-2 TaxID=2320270 RepID=UPI0010A67D4A|nr:ATP-binding protein [Pseudomonas sp. DG56-2]